MAIKFEQNELAGALSSIPELLLKAQQLKLQGDATEQSMNMQNMQMEQRMLQAQRERTALGEDAAGYNNMEITEYFKNLAYSPAAITIGDGDDLNYTGGKFPTIDEAQAQYDKLATAGGKALTNSDSRAFHQHWNEIVAIRNRQFTNELQTLKDQGYDEDDIKDVISMNPDLKASIYNLKGHLDTEQSNFYGQFLPKKSDNFLDRVGDSPLKTVGIGVGSVALAEAGYKFAQSTPMQILDDAKKKYKAQMDGFGKEVLDAEKQLKSEQLLKKTSKGKQGDVKTARKLLKEAKTKLRTNQASSSKELRAMVKENTRWKTLSKSKYGSLKHVGALRGLAPTIFAMGGGTAGQFLGGDEGEAIGRGLGATAGGASMTKFIMTRLAKKAPTIAGKAGLAAMADGPLPIGDMIGAAMGVGLSITEVMSAYKDWQKANK